MLNINTSKFVKIYAQIVSIKDRSQASSAGGGAAASSAGGAPSVGAIGAGAAESGEPGPELIN